MPSIVAISLPSRRSDSSPRTDRSPLRSTRSATAGVPSGNDVRWASPKLTEADGSPWRMISGTATPKTARRSIETPSTLERRRLQRIDIGHLLDGDMGPVLAGSRVHHLQPDDLRAA